MNACAGEVADFRPHEHAGRQIHLVKPESLVSPYNSEYFASYSVARALRSAAEPGILWFNLESS